MFSNIACGERPGANEMGRGPDASASGGRYFLGLDGGQSHTTVLIGNESGRVVGIGSAGPTNRGGSEDARARTEAAIGEALARALDDAGLDGTTRFAAACCGMSGGAETARELLSRHIQTEQTEQTEPLEVVTDAQIALWGATECAPGIVVIAGTGSIAWGEDRAGKTARAGGWGYAFGDEGGGFDIVRRAMRTGLKAEEGWGPETSLRELFLEHSRASTMNDLLHRFYAEGLPRDGIAALAPLVDQAAEGGDEGAREILLGAGRDLARLADAVRGQLFAAGETVTIAYSGGVFRSPAVLAGFRARVAASGREGDCVTAPRRSPAEGALLRAWRGKG